MLQNISLSQEKLVDQFSKESLQKKRGPWCSDGSDRGDDSISLHTESSSWKQYINDPTTIENSFIGDEIKASKERITPTVDVKQNRALCETSISSDSMVNVGIGRTLPIVRIKSM